MLPSFPCYCQECFNEASSVCGRKYRYAKISVKGGALPEWAQQIDL